MIKDADLRLGNKFLHEGEIKTVHTISDLLNEQHADDISGEVLGIKYEDAEPVPITEEFIASKTGIKPDIHGQYQIKGYYLHHHHSGVWNVFNATTPHPLTELNFVHEWQNWHYALNKEELKFKNSELNQ